MGFIAILDYQFPECILFISGFVYCAANESRTLQHHDIIHSSEI